MERVLIMNIRYASEQDRAFLVSNDKWICSGTIQKKIIDKQILVAQDTDFSGSR